LEQNIVGVVTPLLSDLVKGPVRLEEQELAPHALAQRMPDAVKKKTYYLKRRLWDQLQKFLHIEQELVRFCFD
jgi:hypothetical protein